MPVPPQANAGRLGRRGHHVRHGGRYFLVTAGTAVGLGGGGTRDLADDPVPVRPRLGTLWTQRQGHLWTRAAGFARAHGSYFMCQSPGWRRGRRRRARVTFRAACHCPLQRQLRGRSVRSLPAALRLLIVKADGSVLVHSDGGSYKPLNWMSPPCRLAE